MSLNSVEQIDSSTQIGVTNDNMFMLKKHIENLC